MSKNKNEQEIVVNEIIDYTEVKMVTKEEGLKLIEMKAIKISEEILIGRNRLGFKLNKGKPVTDEELSKMISKSKNTILYTKRALGNRKLPKLDILVLLYELFKKNIKDEEFPELSKIGNMELNSEEFEEQQRKQFKEVRFEQKIKVKSIVLEDNTLTEK